MEEFRFLALPQSHVGSDGDLVVVEVGYSTKLRSCGVICGGSGVEVSFGDAINLAFILVQSIEVPVLVVEGVLSTYHLPNGNPAVRGDFERKRGWYHGPGVLSFAASLRFVERLWQILRDHGINKNIYLAEAFLSGKSRKMPKMDGVKAIAQNFWSIHGESLQSGCEPISRYICDVPPVRVF